MASINEVRLMGNLGQDPDLRWTQSGTAVCTLSLATSKHWFDEKSGEKKEQTEWHRVVVWGKAAENIAKQKRKGDQVIVSGYLQTRKYTDGGGIERYATEIVAGQWQWGGVLYTGRAPTNRPGHPADETSEPPPSTGPSARTPGTAAAPTHDGHDYLPPPPPGDDDIPF